MLALFKDLFINLSVLVSFIFIYLQLRWKIRLEKRVNSHSKIIIEGFAGGILGYILMIFSIHVTPETLIDLRFIPIMLIIIFIGVPEAIISTVLIILSRFIFGVTTSAVASMVFMIILITGYMFILKLYKQRLKTYKLSLFMILFANVVFSIIISLLLKDSVILTSLIPTYWIISITGGLTSMFFVKYILKTQYLLMKYERESTTDFLTGLNNVRQFDAIWNSLISNVAAKNEKLSLLLIDIDHFKRINDTYGHPIGDKILVELGGILKDATRSFDVVSRNGGEEFSVILSDCSHSLAKEIAERIRKAVELHKFQVSSKEKIHLTISIGVATFPDTVSDTNQIVDLADECLYRAKRTGRNKVCFSI